MNPLFALSEKASDNLVVAVGIFAIASLIAFACIAQDIVKAWKSVALARLNKKKSQDEEEDSVC